MSEPLFLHSNMWLCTLLWWLLFLLILPFNLHIIIAIHFLWIQKPANPCNLDDRPQNLLMEFFNYTSNVTNSVGNVIVKSIPKYSFDGVFICRIQKYNVRIWRRPKYNISSQNFSSVISSVSTNNHQAQKPSN